VEDSKVGIRNLQKRKSPDALTSTVGWRSSAKSAPRSMSIVLGVMRSERAARISTTVALVDACSVAVASAMREFGIAEIVLICPTASYVKRRLANPSFMRANPMTMLEFAGDATDNSALGAVKAPLYS